MTRRFTVIQGGLGHDAPDRAAQAGVVSAPTGRTRCAIGGGPARPGPADHGTILPFRPSGSLSHRLRPIPALAFVGVRPVAPASGRGDGTAP